MQEKELYKQLTAEEVASLTALTTQCSQIANKVLENTARDLGAHATLTGQLVNAVVLSRSDSTQKTSR